jgi:hypothetical protein
MSLVGVPLGSSDASGAVAAPSPDEHFSARYTPARLNFSL